MSGTTRLSVAALQAAKVSRKGAMNALEKKIKNPAGALADYPVKKKKR